MPAGNIATRSKPVVSMLPDGVDLAVNLWTPEARESLGAAEADLDAGKRPGMIQMDRVRRNLLSSQPLCFNLFGYLAAHPEAALPWIRSLAPDADGVSSIRLEWAPATGTFTGSAFDAFIEYRTGRGTGFLGIECKYAENLAKSQVKPAAEKFRTATADGGWHAGAAEALDKMGLRQFWYNTLLAQLVERAGEHTRGRSVVVALADDVTARSTVDTVAAELVDPEYLVFGSIEEVVDSIEGHDGWRDTFRRRYLDLSPSDEPA
uniref:PGN_0703 family putative restriction endonuclease n=1 Tax=Nocardioides terrisoli TaxID=3388267 RepID=UPI0037C7C17F